MTALLGKVSLACSQSRSWSCNLLFFAPASHIRFHPSTALGSSPGKDGGSHLATSLYKPCKKSEWGALPRTR
nr:hypothetical protein Q903MT_gene1272 [Picea sitchensis]